MILAITKPSEGDAPSTATACSTINASPVITRNENAEFAMPQNSCCERQSASAIPNTPNQESVCTPDQAAEDSDFVPDQVPLDTVINNYSCHILFSNDKFRKPNRDINCI